MIRAKIDVTKILKQHIFVGAKGKYIDITLMDNKNGVDEFGNAGFVIQDICKEAREAGEKGPILGNFKIIGQAAPKPTPAAPPKKTNAEELEGDDVPF
jgi:hypothetical protein